MRRLAVLLCASVLLAACAGGPAPRPSGATAPVLPHDLGPRPAPSLVPGMAGNPDMPAPVPSAIGAQAAEQARGLVGSPYRYGGRDPSGFDCSGLVWYVYQHLGVELPRRSVEQRRSLPAVPRESLEPGDLVFFSSPVDHVGIYLGGGDFVHAPRRGKRVSVANLDAPYFQLGYAGAARVPAP